MSDFVFNIAKGRVAHLASLPGTNDALILIPIEASGVESDATLVDYDDVATLLAAANNEQSTMGRKTITSVSVTVDDSNNRVDVDFADQVWSAKSTSTRLLLSSTVTSETCCSPTTRTPPVATTAR